MVENWLEMVEKRQLVWSVWGGHYCRRSSRLFYCSLFGLNTFLDWDQAMTNIFISKASEVYLPYHRVD